MAFHELSQMLHTTLTCKPAPPSVDFRTAKGKELLKKIWPKFNFVSIFQMKNFEICLLLVALMALFSNPVLAGAEAESESEAESGATMWTTPLTLVFSTILAKILY